MQSSTDNHYVAEEFNENHFYDLHQSDEDFIFQSTEILPNDHRRDQIEPDEDEDFDESQFRASSPLTSGFTGLEIKGQVRTLSPVLFYQTNTRYLIMSNNQLKSLPAEIGNLINLIYLDLSHNRLKTLPSQIGDLIHLKRLYLESNCLKNLPYELGKLNLEDLGLNNNPLGDQILSLFARPNGTREVMNYLREKWILICSYSKMNSYKTSSLPWNETETDAKI